jgi:hypothetical protein
MYIYTDENFLDYTIRTFTEYIPEEELKWHWDEEDRLINPTYDTDWQFQFDDKLPMRMSPNEQIFIPKGVYHRIIKGTGDLSLKIVKV